MPEATALGGATERMSSVHIALAGDVVAQVLGDEQLRAARLQQHHQRAEQQAQQEEAGAGGHEARRSARRVAREVAAEEGRTAASRSRGGW